MRQGRREVLRSLAHDVWKAHVSSLPRAMAAVLPLVVGVQYGSRGIEHILSVEAAFLRVGLSVSRDDVQPYVC